MKVIVSCSLNKLCQLSDPDPEAVVSPPLPACTTVRAAAQGTCWRTMARCPHLTTA